MIDDSGKIAHYNCVVEQRDKAEQAIARVRKIHNNYLEKDECDECEYTYPCPTIKALDGEK